MSPEFYLDVADFLNGLLHLAKEPFEINDVCELWIDALVFQVVLDDELLYNVLVSEDCELLL